MHFICQLRFFLALLLFCCFTNLRAWSLWALTSKLLPACNLAQFGVVASTMFHLTAFASKFASTRFSKTAKVSINSVRACMQSDSFSFSVGAVCGVNIGINGALVFLVRPMDVEHDRTYDALMSKYDALLSKYDAQNHDLTARLADLQASQTSCKVRTWLFSKC